MFWTVILGVLLVIAICVLSVVSYRIRGLKSKIEQDQAKLKEWTMLFGSIAAKRCELESLTEQCVEQDNKLKLVIEQGNHTLSLVMAQIEQETNDLNKLKNKQAELNIIIAQLQQELLSRQSDRETTAKIVEQLQTQVTELQQTKNAAKQRLEEVENGRIMEFNDIDIRLLDTLEALKLQYPQLADAFATIQWSRIVQPKFQAMTTDLLKNKVCGIYRIWTNENGTIKSYIGKSVDIRERWSQHIKKMLGVSAADNQKFYSAVRVYNSHFEVVEACTENRLNELEHYWIKYYSCVEQGYNTKG